MGKNLKKVEERLISLGVSKERTDDEIYHLVRGYLLKEKGINFYCCSDKTYADKWLNEIPDAENKFNVKNINTICYFSNFNYNDINMIKRNILPMPENYEVSTFNDVIQIEYNAICLLAEIYIK